jgi:hypothetical protein
MANIEDTPTKGAVLPLYNPLAPSFLTRFLTIAAGDPLEVPD